VVTTFSDREVGEILSLTAQADSVELKLTVPEADQRSAVAALDMDPIQAQIRQVYFFDTPDLRLDRSGVVARARRVKDRGDDTIVKLRPVVPGELPADLRDAEDFGIEVDAMPAGFVCSGTLKRALETADVRETVGGARPIRKLFSKRQRALLEERTPSGTTWDDLVPLGPVFVLKLKFSPRELGRKMVAEVWLYPDDSRLLELSTKCAPSEAFQTAAETRAFLDARGVDLTGEQQTKTRKALEYFSARLGSQD
jgi:hypothetical protein